MSKSNVLLLPGWQNSDAEHWQSRWEAIYGDHRVEQSDWMWPKRGDWQIQLEEAVLAAPGPVKLVAHSLGCILVAAWASYSRNTAKVEAALLVAPADLERTDLREFIPGWAPIARQRLPFPTLVVASSQDPYCAAERSRQLAVAWGAQYLNAGPRGHLNTASGLGDWPEGRDLLNAIQKKD